MSKSAENVAVLRDIVSVERFYPAANDLAAFTAGLSSLSGGGTLHVPADAYAPAFTTTTLFSIPANTSIVGEGRSSILNIDGTAVSGTKAVFTPSGAGTKVEGLTLNLDVGAAGAGTTTIFATPAYNNYSFIGNIVDCGTVLNAGTQDRVTQIVKGGTTAGIEGTTIGLNHIENFGRIYTRDNATTTAHKRVKAFFNVLKKAWRTTYTFNAPGGSIEDVLVIGETFDTHEGVVQADSGIAGNHNAVGLVGVRGGRVIGNHVTGPYGAIAHIEENTDGAIALGNTARMSNPASTDAALECLANNVSGSTVVPKHVAWIGNVLQSTDGVGKGMYLQSQAGGVALQWGLVSQNIVSDFDEAYRTDTDASSVLVTGNVFIGAVNAAELNRAELLFDRNIVDASVPEPVHMTRGGLLGHIHFVNLAWGPGTPLMTAWPVSAGGPAVLTSWDAQTSALFAIANGTTYLDLGPMPTRAYGTFSIVLSFSATTHRHLEVLFEYDGATITNTTRLTYGSGSITSLAPANNAGNLAITLTNGGATTAASARIQVKFHSGQFIV